MSLTIPKLRAEPNWTILNAIRDASSTEFQRRIPDSTKANVQDNLLNMWDYAPTRNEFLDAFINKIGMQIARQVSWTNPLAKFKIGMLSHGDTIEEYIVGLLQAKAYDPKRDYLERDLFGQELPDVQTSYHKVNRQDWYKVTIHEPMLKRAFLDEFGLSGLIVQLMQTPMTSDNWDEFHLMTQLFSEYYKANGFFKVNVPDIAANSSDAAAAKAFIREVRAYASNLGFLSTAYNAAKMPVAARPDELELFITPEGLAAVDVEALAGAFNLPYSEFGTRYTVVRQEDLRIPGAQAILTTRDFFVVADQRMESRSQPNPIGLYDNYFFHHWQVISASRFVPAILFTSTEATTQIAIESGDVTGIGALTITNWEGASVTNSTVERGKLYDLDASATGVGADTAVRFDLIGAQSTRTILSQTGTLFVSPDEDAQTLTVRMYSVADETVSTQVALNVIGANVQVWPDSAVFEDEDADGLKEIAVVKPVPAAPTSGTNKNKVTIPDPTEGYDYKDGGTTVNGQTLTLTANKTITAVAKTGYEFAAGVTTSFPLTYTP